MNLHLLLSAVVVYTFMQYVFPPARAQETHNYREYEEGHQFPDGSEHLTFPKTVTYSIYMGERQCFPLIRTSRISNFPPMIGKMKYGHIPLLFNSMKWNGPFAEFVIINVIADGSDQV